MVRTFQGCGPRSGEVFQIIASGEVFYGPNGGRREGNVGQVLHQKTRPLHEVSGVDT